MFDTNLIFAAGIGLAYVIVFAIIFAESGLLIGFFLPGDSFLVALGVLASQGRLDLALILGIGSLAAILGDSVGYTTGFKFGPALFNRPDSQLFKKENLEQAQLFYKKHGTKTIFLARFIPVVRTFAPIVAGAARMPYRTFITYNIVGGISWVLSITLIGYFIGSRIGNIDRFILPILGVVIAISLISPFVHHQTKKKRSTK